jgi:probable FeS assembly SUF system protein SufT
MAGRMFDEITFKRDCAAILVPDGFETEIPAGTLGFITQVLGGNFTVQMANGYLVRVSGKDADALGREPEAEPEALTDDEGNLVVSEEQVWAELKKCFDPEIPVNIVELGLVYGCQIAERTDAEGYKVSVAMTLTAPGCGMGQILCDDVDYCVRSIPGVTDAEVELTFDPPWSPERMSEEARLELGLM